MAITFEEVSYEYAPNSPFAYHALKDVSAHIVEGSMTAIIGATGSGKSTLVQHLNGLLEPSSGRVRIFDYILNSGVKNTGLKALRQRVGLVFQFPELQLFEESIIKDVSFGPKNFGMSEEEITANVSRALNLVGISESLWERSPLDLSGGQKRRVAIAGVLATDPELIVLDEPTAGLDPQGTKNMMALFQRLNKELNKTIVMVTHDMDHVLKYCEHVIVMNEGSVLYQGKTQEFFADAENLNKLGFVLPKIISLNDQLADKGFNFDRSWNIETLAQQIGAEVKR